MTVLFRLAADRRRIYNQSMAGFDGMGKILIGLGIFLVVLGLIFVFWQKIPLLGRLPGDFSFSKGGITFFFPLATSLIISLLLTIVVNLVIRLFIRH